MYDCSMLAEKKNCKNNKNQIKTKMNISKTYDHNTLKLGEHSSTYTTGSFDM